MRIPRSFTPLVLAALVSVATTAHAQINLAWNDCITQPGAAEMVRYACDGSQVDVPYRAVISFICPADLPAFVGVLITLDVAPLGGRIPDFWRMGSGDCRGGAFSFTGCPSEIGTGARGACRNPWLARITGGGFVYCSDGDCSDGAALPPGHAKVKLAFARGNSTPLRLERGAQYVAGVISIDPEMGFDAGNGKCAGCEEFMILTLKEVGVYQQFATPPQDIYLLTAPATRASVMWQPDHLQLHNRTWGAIKATYR